MKAHNLSAVHLRLMAQLPVRTHTRKEAPRKQSQGRSKPIRAMGVEYGGFRQCWKSLRISPLTLSKWLRDGRAEYV